MYTSNFTINIVHYFLTIVKRLYNFLKSKGYYYIIIPFTAYFCFTSVTSGFSAVLTLSFLLLLSIDIEEKMIIAANTTNIKPSQIKSGIIKLPISTLGSSPVAGTSIL